MRILRANSLYSSYVTWHYARHPELAGASYARQMEALIADGFSWAESWQRHLQASAAAEVVEFLVNVEPLQKAWARERGAPFQPESWMIDIFLAQLRETKPDLLFAPALEISRRILPQVRTEFPRLRIVAYDGVGFNAREFIGTTELVLACGRDAVDFYRAQGCRSEQVRWGFDAGVLNRLDRAGSRAVDFSFIGSVQPAIGHIQRAKVLDALARSTALELWLGELPGASDMLRRQVGLLRRGRLREAAKIAGMAPVLGRLRRRSQGTLFGMAMLGQLAASKVSLNVHIDTAGRYAGNMRLYEATGVGSCLLTDWKENLGDLFELDREIVTFRTIEEAKEKAAWLLAHEAERQEIARRGQRRTLADYSVGTEIERIGRMFAQLLG